LFDFFPFLFSLGAFLRFKLMTDRAEQRLQLFISRASCNARRCECPNQRFARLAQAHLHTNL